MPAKAKKTNLDQLEKRRREKRQHKLSSLKNEFESGKIKSFDQIFAIFSPSPLALELTIPYYSFLVKINDPRHFKVAEILNFAKLIDVEDEIIYRFIKNLIHTKK
ncbi:MAG TPA: hypothetical protein VFQ86_04750 [Arachidicoccus soli]|nr:hypothetical protein [Arachidicoccus soli]